MTNPYLTVGGCVDRLYKQWLKHPRLIVACDWDDTVVFFNEDSGDDFSDTINVLKRAAKHNFLIIIYTCSNKERHKSIIDYCANLGIEVATVNKNIIDLGFEPQAKIYYNILLDDKAGLAQSIETLNKLIDKIEAHN